MGGEHRHAPQAVYPPHATLATVLWLRTLIFGLELARRLDDDPSGVEIDAGRDPLGERQKQGFAALNRRDLENVAGAMVHERDDPADRRSGRVDRLESDQIVVVEFVMRWRRQLIAPGEDLNALQR